MELKGSLCIKRDRPSLSKKLYILAGVSNILIISYMIVSLYLDYYYGYCFNYVNWRNIKMFYNRFYFTESMTCVLRKFV